MEHIHAKNRHECEIYTAEVENLQQATLYVLWLYNIVSQP